MNSESLTLSPAEAAPLLGLSVQSVRNGCRRGEIPTIRVGTRNRIPKAALDELLRTGNVARAQRPTPAPAPLPSRGEPRYTLSLMPDSRQRA